jgi:hypothetical protein
MKKKKVAKIPKKFRQKGKRLSWLLRGEFVKHYSFHTGKYLSSDVGIFLIFPFFFFFGIYFFTKKLFSFQIGFYCVWNGKFFCE